MSLAHEFGRRVRKDFEAKRAGEGRYFDADRLEDELEELEKGLASGRGVGRLQGGGKRSWFSYMKQRLSIVLTFIAHRFACRISPACEKMRSHCVDVAGMARYF